MNEHKEQDIDNQKRNTQDQELNNNQHQEQISSLSHVNQQEATPLREQRQRRNLRLPGDVDVESVSSSNYSLGQNRRESWVDRINQAAKNAIKRTSYVATETDRPLIDKIADSMNKYNNEEEAPEKESWTDKVMNILFPSLQVSTSKVEPEIAIRETTITTTHYGDDEEEKSTQTPETIPSDDHYDQVQDSTNQDIEQSWRKEAMTLAQEVDKHALNQHPDKKVVIESSDEIYDDAQSELPAPSMIEEMNSDANRPIVTEKRNRHQRRMSTVSSSDHQLERFKEQKLALENQPPPEFRDRPPYDVIDNKKERHRLRKQKLVEEQDVLGKQSHFDNDFENWTARPRQL